MNCNQKEINYFFKVIDYFLKVKWNIHFPNILLSLSTKHCDREVHNPKFESDYNRR